MDAGKSDPKGAEIEITPAMIAAAADVLLVDGVLERHLGRARAEFLAEDMLEAALSVLPPKTRPACSSALRPKTDADPDP